jgi:hypothetical protein
MDAFVQYRRSLGLAASVVNIGVIEDVGYVNDNPAILDSLRATAQYLMRESDLLTSIELMLRRSSPSSSDTCRLVAPPTTGARSTRFVERAQIGIDMRSRLPIRTDNNRTIWRKDPRMLIYRNVEKGAVAESVGDNTGDAVFKQFLKNVSSNISFLKSEDAATTLAIEIGRTLFRFSMRGDDFDVTTELNLPLASVGIDSLISIEVRNWIRKNIGIDFTVLDIVKSDNIRQMGEKAQAKLVEKLETTLWTVQRSERLTQDESCLKQYIVIDHAIISYRSFRTSA